MQAPIVHLNGSDKSTLIKGYKAAWHAVMRAIEALQENAPHARDYYVDPDPQAFEKARAEHVARLEALDKVQNDLAELALAVEDQGH